MGVIKRLLSVPILWDSVQSVLGAMKFKRELYLSNSILLANCLISVVQTAISPMPLPDSILWCGH